jgi:hypothetical protein
MDYYDLGTFTRPITAATPEAQTWFDRGLNWLYAYNHGEAIACFQKAIDSDPACAMAHWGVAYATGPNYNLPWHLYDPAGRAKALGAAYDAMKLALSHMDGVSAVEEAMIKALPARYPQREPIDDLMPWNKDFTRAMRGVLDTYPNDLEVLAVFAESIMHDRGARSSGEGLSGEPRLLGSSRALASLRPLDGDVALPRIGLAGRRPSA